MSEVVLKDSVPRSGEFNDGKMWFHRKGSIVTIGITSSAVEEIGEFDGIDFPEEGDDFDKGDVFLTIDGNLGKLEAITPAAGVVTEINEAAAEEATVVSEDPLEEGWLIKIEIQDTSDLQEFALPS
ncbi:MAG: glycine cleavage system protein H [Methylotenera sp.]|nr:glycine cleavage system protein H [Oligoflexia bacterium]